MNIKIFDIIQAGHYIESYMAGTKLEAWTRLKREYPDDCFCMRIMERPHNNWRLGNVFIEQKEEVKYEAS